MRLRWICPELESADPILWQKQTRLWPIFFDWQLCKSLIGFSGHARPMHMQTCNGSSQSDHLCSQRTYKPPTRRTRGNSLVLFCTYLLDRLNKEPRLVLNLCVRQFGSTVLLVHLFTKREVARRSGAFWCCLLYLELLLVLFQPSIAEHPYRKHAAAIGTA